MKVKSEGEVAQLCLTLSDPMDYSLPGSSDQSRQHIKKHIYECIYMEFRKTTFLNCKVVMTTLYARQQKRHRCIEQSFGLWEREKG